MADEGLTRADVVEALVRPVVGSRQVPGGVSCLALSTDGKLLVVGTRRGLVRCQLVDEDGPRARFRAWRRRQVRRQVDLPLHDAEVSAVTVLPAEDGTPIVISGDTAGAVHVGDASTGSGRRAAEFGAPIVALASTVANAGPVIAVATGGGVAVYDDPRLESATSHDHPVTVTCLAAGVRDGRPFVVFGDLEGQVWLWDVESGTRPERVERLAGGPVTAVAAGVTGAGLRIAAGDGRGTIVTGEVAADGLTLEGPTRKLSHQGAVLAVAVGEVPQRGAMVLSVGDDRVIRSWPLGGGWPSFASDVGDVRFLAISGGERPQVAFNLDDAQLRALALAEFLARALPNVERPETWAVSDAPIEDDSQDGLGFAAYADALAFMIDHPGTSTPLSIAIDAPWGAGKTSLANLIRARLAPEGETVSATNQGGVVHLSVWFNAWMHDEEGSLASALARAVVREVAKHRAWWRRAFQPVPAALLGTAARVRRVLAATVLSAVAAGGGTLLWVAASPDGVFQMAGFISAVGLVPLATLGVTVMGKAGGAVKHYVRSPQAAARQGWIADARCQLERLIHQATRRQGLSRPRRLVVFIDDLERCEPPRSLEVCQVVNQLIGHEDVVTVLLVDMETIAASAEVKYSDVAEKLFPASGGRGYGQNFLEKVVQFHFSLPRHTAAVEELGTTMAPGRATSGSRHGIGLARRTIDGLRRAMGAPLRLGKRWVRAWWQKRRSEDGTRFWQNPWQRLKAGITGDRLIGLAVYAGIIAVAAVIYHALGRNDTSVTALIAAFVVAAVFGWRGYREEIREAIRAVAHWLRLAMSERARYLHQQQLIEEALRSVPEEGGQRTSLSGLTDVVQRRLGGQHVNEKLLSWEVRRRAVDDSAVRQAAEREAVRWLPAVPRKAKRVANNLAVLLAIMYERGLLEGDAKVSAAQLGKWVAFGERYPAVARAVHRRPQLLLELTGAARSERIGVEQVLEQHAIGVPAEVTTMAKLLANDPPLSDVVIQLTQHRAPTADDQLLAQELEEPAGRP